MQIVDRREIEFDADALHYCLCASPGAAQSIGLPGTPPVQVRIGGAENLIEIEYGKEGPATVARVAPQSLGALLIGYCIRAGIPMPRIADKRVRMSIDCLVLEIIGRFDKPPAGDASDPIIHQHPGKSAGI